MPEEYNQFLHGYIKHRTHPLFQPGDCLYLLIHLNHLPLHLIDIPDVKHLSLDILQHPYVSGIDIITFEHLPTTFDLRCQIEVVHEVQLVQLHCVLVVDAHLHFKFRVIETESEVLKVDIF